MRRVVVTGCGVISALGRGRSAFFSSLGEGRSGIGPISLFDTSTFPVKLAAEVRDLDRDAIAAAYPGPAARWDRKVWLALAAFDDLLADAGISSDMLSRTGVGLNVGVSLEVLPLEALRRPAAGSESGLAELLRAIADMGEPLQTPLDTASRLLVARHGLRGPCYVNGSACAASTQAIGHSFELIRRGQADAFVCGGFDSMIHPLGIGGFALLGALSTRDPQAGPACRPFDAKRDGTVIGEGAGFVLLEALDLALERGASIMAEVTGYGASLDAFKPTDPDPEGRGMRSAMERALANAGLGPDGIGYINAHGTSTPKNDEIETKAIKAVFGEAARRIPVSSTKSMIGHLIGAAGAVEFIACLSAFARDLIPPTINYEHPDGFCDLDYVPNRARPWSGDTILTNSFGFGGQNAALVLRRWRGTP